MLLPVTRRIARGLGGPDCDPFWTEMNGACSDQFGQFIGPSSSSVFSTNPGFSLSKVPAFIWYAAGGLLLLTVFQRDSKRAARSQAKAEYEKRLAEIEDEYSASGTARRAGKSVARAAKRTKRQLLG